MAAPARADTATGPGEVATGPGDVAVDAEDGGADLASAFVAGRDGALAAVYHEHASLVMGVAARAVGRADAEDVTQAVFVSAWRGRSTFDPSRGSLRGWLVGITRRRVADALGARHRRGEVLVEPGDALAAERPEEASEHEEATADRVTVMGAVADLAEPRRTVVALAFFEEMTHREISETTGLPLGTVKSHLRRALLHLRHLLEPAVTHAATDGAATDGAAGRAGPGGAGAADGGGAPAAGTSDATTGAGGGAGPVGGGRT